MRLRPRVSRRPAEGALGSAPGSPPESLGPGLGEARSALRRTSCASLASRVPCTLETPVTSCTLCPPSRSTYCAHGLCLAPAQGKCYSRDGDRGRLGPKEQQRTVPDPPGTAEPEPPRTARAGAARAGAAGAGPRAGQEHPASFSQLPFHRGGGSERPHALPGVTQPGQGPGAALRFRSPRGL